MGVTIENKHGYVNKSGELVIEAKYEDALPFSQDLAAVKVGQEWGYIDPSGKIVINPQFVSAECFSGGYAKAEGEKWGIIDRTGQFVIPPEYSGFGYLHADNHKLLPVFMAGLYGFMDLTGKIVVPPIFDDASDFDQNGVSTVIVGPKVGYINDLGEVIWEPSE